MQAGSLAEIVRPVPAFGLAVEDRQRDDVRVLLRFDTLTV